MFLDKELDVICLLQAELKHSEPLLYKSNSFCKKVLCYIKSINSFSDNSGHEALPPDYYSDELNCMFDVMRVNISTLSLAKNSACQNIRTPYNIKCEEILIISRIHILYFKRTYHITG